jgi:hypothetical protein
MRDGLIAEEKPNVTSVIPTKFFLLNSVKVLPTETIGTAMPAYLARMMS